MSSPSSSSSYCSDPEYPPTGDIQPFRFEPEVKAKPNIPPPQPDTKNSESEKLKISSGTVGNLPADDVIRKLINQAMAMRGRAYCPYSNFRVGASVLTPDNSIYTGCNVENASYGLTLCAERIAICNAVADSHRKFTAMAVCCDIKGDFKAPCGACRQTLVEFGTDWSLYCVKPNGDYLEVSVNDLLPMGFHPAALQEERA